MVRCDINMISIVLAISGQSFEVTHVDLKSLLINGVVKSEHAACFFIFKDLKASLKWAQQLRRLFFKELSIRKQPFQC